MNRKPMKSEELLHPSFFRQLAFNILSNGYIESDLVSNKCRTKIAEDACLRSAKQFGFTAYFEKGLSDAPSKRFDCIIMNRAKLSILCEWENNINSCLSELEKLIIACFNRKCSGILITYSHSYCAAIKCLKDVIIFCRDKFNGYTTIDSPSGAIYFAILPKNLHSIPDCPNPQGIFMRFCLEAYEFMGDSFAFSDEYDPDGFKELFKINQ